jgi:hypothetical protein
MKIRFSQGLDGMCLIIVMKLLHTFDKCMIYCFFYLCMIYLIIKRLGVLMYSLYSERYDKIEGGAVDI